MLAEIEKAMTSSHKGGVSLSDGSPPSTSACSGQPKGTEDHSQPLALNCNACLNLKAIIESFSGPIKEEHAWGIIYECCKCLQKVFSLPQDQASEPGPGKN
jgi:hypothetical protein